MFHHVPPTATPLRLSDLGSGLLARRSAVDDFAASLARYLGLPHCLLAASGRTALYLLLRALRETPSLAGRTEVVLPAYTCPSVAKVILDVGLRLRLVDIDSHTMEFEPEGLTASVGPDTLAVVCVHPFGIPQPLERARSLAHAAGACVIEDGAQSLGARAGGTPIGGRGDFGLFSLGPGKPLSTGGGGILCTASDTHAEALAAQWATLRSAGGTASGMALARLGAFSTAFHPTAWWLAARAGAQRVGDNEASWGYALRSLTPAQAAIGLRLLPRLDAFNAGRRSRAAAWRTALAGVDGVRWPAVPTAAAGADTGRDGAIYLRLPMLVRDEATADRLCAALNAAGIGAGRMYRRTLAEIFPAAARAAFPGATRVARMLVTLPTNHYLTADDLARGAAVIRREMACA